MPDTKGLILGEIAVREKILTEVELDECIQQQIDERYRRPLGEIMIERGFVDQEGMDALLEAQRSAIEEFEKSADYAHLFGRIAVARGLITDVQLAQAIRAQIRKHARGFKSKIGQVMIELGLIDLQKFWAILSAQGDFQCGACGQKLEKPWFKGETVVCEYCKSPAFSVTPDKPGPRPTKRRTRK